MLLIDYLPAGEQLVQMGREVRRLGARASTSSAGEGQVGHCGHRGKRGKREKLAEEERPELLSLRLSAHLSGRPLSGALGFLSAWQTGSFLLVWGLH